MMRVNLKRLGVVVGVMMGGLSTQTVFAEPPSICAVHMARIESIKASIDQYHADKEQRAQALPRLVQACTVAREEIKVRIRAAQASHDRDLERSLTHELDEKSADCQRLFDEMMDFRDSLDAAYTQILQESTRQITDITRAMAAARCDHPCAVNPGYCYTQAPDTGMLARARTDDGRITGVSGRLHGSCTTQLPPAIPAAFPSTMCEEFYNLGDGDISVVRQTCADMHGSWAAAACTTRQVQGICTIARTASPTHAVQRNFSYLDNFQTADEQKKSCIVHAGGMWEYPLN